jgi:hypothetical protein
MTAIDWLINQLTEVDKGCINKTYLHPNKTLGGIHLKEIFENAKILEKQQIIKARLSLDQSIHFEDALDNAEQYFEKTFNQSNQ